MESLASLPLATALQPRLCSAPLGMTLAPCCSRAVNHAAWAQTKRHFFFAENRSGKFNSKHCADCDRRKFFFRQERIHHGGLTTCSSSRTFHHHADRSAGLPLRW